ncbi:COG4223 family protein [Tritonibacter multivorans]|uniref:COG4223 family protein n=1 Tax=Tritonibacter multivorans TaxID=928856 RepID=UPI0008E9EBE7|nr:hypothetical protein [Tritonibacter multivorans]SFC03287.1 hypothetical protein SAMN04488049_101164 [Tritonibacter multivorans]
MAEEKKSQKASDAVEAAEQDVAKQPLVEEVAEDVVEELEAEDVSAEADADDSKDENRETEVDAEESADELSSETETETETENVSAIEEPPAPVVEKVVEKRGGFGAALLGGVVAAGLGFVVGQGDLLNSVLPASFQKPDVDLTPLETTQASLKEDVAALQNWQAENQGPDLGPLETRLTALETAADDADARLNLLAGAQDLTEQLADLSARVDALEARPLTEGASADAVAAFEAQLAKVRENLSAQQDEVKAMVAEAQAMEQASAEAARIASAQGVASRLIAALDAGKPFGPLLDELSALKVDAPSELAGTADAGVATQAALRDGFAPAARAALSEAREENKAAGGLLDYVNRHLGARSVAPREGSDADAVLSRAEAAVRSGNIQLALSELSELPEAAKPAIADWETAAQTRLSAMAAAEALSQSLNAK